MTDQAANLRSYIHSRIAYEDRGYLTPCWVWQFALNHAGYGRHVPKCGQTLSHRLSFHVFKGNIPQGLAVDHLCRVKACCNPDHLDAVTHSENMSRMYWAILGNHCRNGHEIGVVGRNAKGCCRECQRIAQRRFRHRASLLEGVAA